MVILQGTYWLEERELYILGSPKGEEMILEKLKKRELIEMVKQLMGVAKTNKELAEKAVGQFEELSALTLETEEPTSEQIH